MTAQVTRDPMERFLEKVDKTGDCWLWTASTTPAGYGEFSYQCRNVYAHRWLFEQTQGPIPAGHDLDHLCRVRSCVNPAHLEPVTRRVNTARGTNKAANAILTNHCWAGHEFTEENTQIGTGGGRRCKTCKADSQRRIREKRRVERLEP